MLSHAIIVDTLKAQFGDSVTGSEEFRGQLSVFVAPERIAEVCAFLRDDARFAFEMLTDLTAVDFQPAVPRFQVVYNLYSFRHNRRLRLKVPLPVNETIGSVEGIWKAANWLEREVYDLFGIVFDNHCDLRRILLWDGYIGHPLRKDFPMHGIPQNVRYT